MESIMTFESQDQMARNLQECTDRIRRVLAQLHSQSTENATKIASPEQMGDLLSELMRAGKYLRILPPVRDPDVEQGVSEYRAEVERLRSLLPALQASLLSERGRLERERERLNGASGWAQATRHMNAK